MMTAMMTIMMMTMTMIMIEIIVIVCYDDEYGNADKSNYGNFSHRGKSAERAVFKVRYFSFSVRFL